MNPDEFDKWLDTRPYSKWEAFKNRNTSQVMWMRDAWDASKAEERERCAKIAEGRMLNDAREIDNYTQASCDALCQSLAEQIRKGE